MRSLGLTAGIPSRPFDAAQLFAKIPTQLGLELEHDRFALLATAGGDRYDVLARQLVEGSWQQLRDRPGAHRTRLYSATSTRTPGRRACRVRASCAKVRRPSRFLVSIGRFPGLCVSHLAERKCIVYRDFGDGRTPLR